MCPLDLLAPSPSPFLNIILQHKTNTHLILIRHHFNRIISTHNKFTATMEFFAIFADHVEPEKANIHCYRCQRNWALSKAITDYQ